MRYTPIKTQAIVILIIVMVLPIILVGITTTMYYRDVTRQSIWEGNLGRAETISAFTSQYVDSAIHYVESQAARPSVYEAVNTSNTAFLNNTIMYIQNSSIFYNVYVTDYTGTVISSYPLDITGRNDSDKPWVSEVLRNKNGYISDSTFSVVTGKPTVFISAPIMQNKTIKGVMVGSLDLYYYGNYLKTRNMPGNEYVYLVNRTGHVMVHTNRSYMDIMQNVSTREGVDRALLGEDGIIEQYNPLEKADKLASYSAIPKYGWGVVISVPTAVAYEPINRATSWLIAFISIMIILAVAIAGLISTSIVNPLLHMIIATSRMPYGDYRKDLPLERQDEIGDLARSFDHMAGDIRESQQKTEAARDQAEEEKSRAELYVDIMGHDINNLNQTALASLELLGMDTELTDEQRELASNAITSISGSAGIIDNVRKIQKITGEEVHLEDVDIDEMIRKCIAESPRPQGKKVVINYSSRHGMIIKGTPLLKEVFCNIIGNSIKYSGSEVTVDIDTQRITEPGKSYYEVAIADNGYGITDEVKPRIFRRFERGTTKAHGKGLGLYIVKMLVERFGGSVEVQDRVPGDYKKGAKFVVRLPAAK